ncbi:putative 3'-5' exoribonuclease [Paratrimastix pyriformis]|uniref:3'-5' exoribonuclease n=1 Tax=Paratrimastix pyriformis TaxID=342808 RepID=A0ABQ8UKZ3_9EUKA|nr:putative 3'-5' exoribonuclease [Paratrimastix pyriformis]
MQIASATTGTPQFAVAGQQLGLASTYLAGDGTYLNEGWICSSTVGYVQVIPGQKPRLEIQRKRDEVIVPQQGNIVLCRVIKITHRSALCHILSVGDKTLNEPFSGIIRKQDVRATETDKVEIVKSFRPGDIVRAEVVSPGDSRSFLLSTAKNELGVLFAQSIVGEFMVPVSWQEMECPRTHVREYRKVAKQ